MEPQINNSESLEHMPEQHKNGDTTVNQLSKCQVMD